MFELFSTKKTVKINLAEFEIQSKVWTPSIFHRFYICFPKSERHIFAFSADSWLSCFAVSSQPSALCALWRVSPPANVSRCQYWLLSFYVWLPGSGWRLGLFINKVRVRVGATIDVILVLKPPLSTWAGTDGSHWYSRMQARTHAHSHTQAHTLATTTRTRTRHMRRQLAHKGPGPLVICVKCIYDNAKKNYVNVNAKLLRQQEQYEKMMTA